MQYQQAPINILLVHYLCSKTTLVFLQILLPSDRTGLAVSHVSGLQTFQVNLDSGGCGLSPYRLQHSVAINRLASEYQHVSIHTEIILCLPYYMSSIQYQYTWTQNEAG